MSVVTKSVSFSWRDVDVVDFSDGAVSTVKAMVPVARFRRFADAQYVDGHIYRLGPAEEQSEKSRGHYFACIHLIYLNLPESLSGRWPSETHMRKWALIETNWCDEKEFDCADEKQAFRLGHFIRSEDPYARIAIRGTTVIVRKAVTQSPKAMGREKFQKSKQDVLDILEFLTSIPTAAVKKEAKKVEARG